LAAEGWGALAGVVVVVVMMAVAAWRGARARRRPAGWSSLDLDQLAEWVALRLPPEVGRSLSLPDVRRIVGWNHEYFLSRSVAGNGHGDQVASPFMVTGAETVDWVLSRAEAEERAYTASQVHAVLAAQVRYLGEHGFTR
jgi:hypothetical protein